METAKVIPLPHGDKWARADRAFKKGHDAYIEFGQACAALNTEGITQQEIAARYDMARSAVAHAIAVGNDKRIVSNTNTPKSQHALYLLTTLDDEGFEKLAKMDTTQADIIAYKRGQQPKQKREQPPKQFRITRNILLAERMGITERQAAALVTKNRAWFADKPKQFTDQAAAEAFVLLCIETFPSAPQKKPELPESAKQKLERAIAIETARLRDEHLKMLFAEVNRRLPELTAQREREMQENREETARYNAIVKGTKKLITEDEYRFLLQVLHPDRAPADRKEQYSRAFQIVMKLKLYAEA